MAKNILIPCQPCKEEFLKDVSEEDRERGVIGSPTRNIVSGKLLSEDENDANFELALTCGHTIEFTFSQEEKPDVVELLAELGGE